MCFFLSNEFHVRHCGKRQDKKRIRRGCDGIPSRKARGGARNIFQGCQSARTPAHALAAHMNLFMEKRGIDGLRRPLHVATKCGHVR